MRKIIIIPVGLLLTFFIWQCKNLSDPLSGLPGEDDLFVTWELAGNTFSDQTVCDAPFVIENLSKNQLCHTGWTIYFNQFPRTIIPESVSKEVRIK